jgi:hypothetical protein
MNKCILFFVAFFLTGTGVAQNVGIGTSTPVARLQVVDSSVVFSATGEAPVTAGNPPVSGSGRRLMWYADKAAFRAGFAFNDWNKDSVGTYSFGGGFNNVSLGGYSFSMGLGNRSVANGSSTLGSYNIATGANSLAMGYNNAAKAPYSTVAGFNNLSNAYASFTIGMYNDSIVAAEGAPVAGSPIFIIGNGVVGARKNAMVVRRDGDVGIGTNFPSARLHVADSSVLFSATGLTPAMPGLPPVSGAGRRMMWYADKAAFRAGYVSDNNWNKDSVGDYSVAMGSNPRASGYSSLALGTSVSDGFKTISMGNSTRANGDYAFAMGNSTTAYGESSMTLGYLSTAYGDKSTAMGFNTNAVGYSAHSMGRFTDAVGDHSTTMGFATNANGAYSTALGMYTTANGFATLSVGMYGDSIVARQTVASTGTPLFIIGNGDDFNNRSNALVVRKDGRMGLGTDYPLTTLHVKQVGGAGGIMLENVANGNKWRLYSASGDNNLTFYNNANVEIADINDATGAYTALSDSRFKKDIEPMQQVLPKLLKLEPRYYHFNWQQHEATKEIGMLAQHTYALFPELVSYDKENDIYKMNYAGFSTVAIKGIQEQQVIIQHLQAEVKEQKEKLHKLEEEMKAIKEMLKKQDSLGQLK